MPATPKPATADELYKIARDLPRAAQRRLLNAAKKEVKALAAKQKAKVRILNQIRKGMIEAKEIAAGRKKGIPWDEFLKRMESW